MVTSNSLTSISRQVCRNLFSNQKPFYYTTTSLFSNGPSTPEFNSDSTPDDSELPTLNSDSESTEFSPDNSAPSSSEFASASPDSAGQRPFIQTVLEGGLDIGIYKAILVGQVGQSPLQKRLKNGKLVTLTTLGTGGIRNERIPFPNEEPREYADRCNVQWHRVAIYPERLGEVVLKNAQPGSLLYLEGNLETKIYTDQVSGIVKRVREIAVRRNGRIIFLGFGSDFRQPSVQELRGVGYF
ncbi:single-stranded DNA-binding protein, mitochondrial-like [Chenopodium quinoa]|uniref:single-stranded DNA-binding protein, mitochondrial-like n=1 Tax=Chenopodium quinoa TaxID=63459 RepID=UPI000B775833|nr:single-stranded DNA-binding protein, mitochondrial-like [Chenopodium quinoa]